MKPYVKRLMNVLAILPPAAWVLFVTLGLFLISPPANFFLEAWIIAGVLPAIGWIALMAVINYVLVGALRVWYTHEQIYEATDPQKDEG